MGPLIHNPVEVERLKKLNIVPLKRKNIKEGVIITRTHGIEKNNFEKLKMREKITIIDATCPFVKRAQKLANRLVKEKYKILIIGDKKHPEVKCLLSYSNGKGKVIDTLDDVKNVNLNEKVALISQTTQHESKFEMIKKYLEKKAKDFIAYNTICKSTIERQNEAKKIAKECDLVLVVGGKNSSNTNRLLEICKKYTKSYLVETKEDIKKEWLKKIKRVGIVGGASTPIYLIEEVIKKCQTINY
jgi:4-hydroxy-3-methylbut-2-enyl diphosphate reductase